MYIKNISQLINEHLPLKFNVMEGSIIYGKAIFDEDGKGAVKLYDNTIIPAIFISDDNIKKDAFTRFEIKSFNDNTLTLKAVFENERTSTEKSIDSIVKNLNIPLEEGREIVMSLLKYNLPASHENIMRIYKNIKFINQLKSMDDQAILSILQEKLNNIGYENTFQANYKEVISTLKNIDINFLSFLLQNNIPENIDNILKICAFLKDKHSMNTLVQILSTVIEDNNQKQLEGSSSSMQLINLNITVKDTDTALNYFINNKTNFEEESNTKKANDLKKLPLHEENHKITRSKTFLDVLSDSIIKSSGIKSKPCLMSFDEAVKILKNNPELVKHIPQEILKRIAENTDMLKYINNNYSLYLFNSHNKTEIFKNSIIIKNKYKNSRYIDVNDVKVYISVETPKIGTVEGYLLKKNNDIIVSLKAEEKYLSAFKSKLDILKNNLIKLGYNPINISVEKIDSEKNLVTLTDFFDDFIFRELDVKV